MKKALSLVLSVSLVLAVLFVGNPDILRVSAASQGFVDATEVNIRADASVASKSLGVVSKVYVEIKGTKKGSDGYTWYYIAYNNITGYIRGDFITLIPEYVPDKTFEEQIAAFPESYRDALRDLHAIYPNWKFTADNIPLTLDEAVSLEIGRKKTQKSSSKSWYSMGLGAYDWATGKWVETEGGWIYASRELIKYYMDPRNFLNASEIYSYMPQDFDAKSQNEEGLLKIIKGTFLEKGYSDPKDTAYGGSYVKVLMAAAAASKVNPYILAASIIQEQGTNGTSSMISGTYSGFQGYYNFFNVSATGSTETEVIRNGLTFAKNVGWSTRSASIIGGAQFNGNNYVSAGQNTYFYMNYNIKNPNSIYHQYATAVHHVSSSAKGVAKNYSGLKEAALEFLIPVYKDMPSEASPLPEKSDKLNNYYFESISVEGLSPSFTKFNYNYDLHVKKDTTVKITLPKNATYAGSKTFVLKKANSQNKVVLKVKSQTGYINEYTISVKADNDCILYIDDGTGIVKPPDTTSSAPSSSGSTTSSSVSSTTSGTTSSTTSSAAPPVTSKPTVPAVMKGDPSGDGKITLVDLASVQMHLLNVRTLSGNGFTGGDVNGDGKITLVDLAMVQMHILGIKKIS